MGRESGIQLFGRSGQAHVCRPRKGGIEVAIVRRVGGCQFGEPVLEVAPFGLGLGEFERALVGLPGLGVAAVASEQVGPGGVVVAVAVEPELVEDG